MLLHSMIIMNFFKTEEQKTRKNINKILEICDLQRLKKIEQVLLTGVVQVDSLEVQEKPQIKYQTVSSDEATQETKSTPTQKVNKATKTIFFKKSMLGKSAIGIISKFRARGVGVKFYETEAMKKSKYDDMGLKCVTGSSDEFVKLVIEWNEYLQTKGFHAEKFNRLVNQGGQTL